MQLRDLQVIGTSVPVSVSGDLPVPVRELLETHGEGSLLGLFHVASRGSATWRTWQETARTFRECGYWAGLPSTLWRQLVVVAVDARGWAIAMMRAGTYLLAPSGAAFELKSVDDLVRYATNSFNTEIPAALRGTKSKDLRTHLGLEFERVYVCSDRRDAAARYVDALDGSDDTTIQAALERALESEPLLIAYTRLLWTVCGPGADGVGASQRADTIETVLALVHRREPYLVGTWLPASIAKGADDPDVRAWAEAPFAPDDAHGPFAGAVAPGLEVEIDDSERPHPSAVWIEPAATLTAWVEAWRADPAIDLGALNALRERCARHPLCFVLVQRIIQLVRPRVFAREPALAFVDEGTYQREATIVTRMVVSRESVWPFALLSLRSVDGGVARTLLDTLAGVTDPIAESLLRSLALRPNFSSPRIGGCGIDPGQYGAAYVRDHSPPAELVERLVSALAEELARRGGDPWLTDRTDDPLDGLLRMIAARVDVPSARAFACKHFNIRSNVFGPALGNAPDAQTLTVLHKKAQGRDVNVRIDAARALVTAGDPKGTELLAAAIRAHEREAEKI